MRVVMFYHSAISDWNHGNAHFLRGIATELTARGHDVCVYEPRDAWSVCNLLQEHGESAILKFREFYPDVQVVRYDRNSLGLDKALDAADLVLVHEWNDPEIVSSIGQHRLRNHSYQLFFHDTHHRSISDPSAMASYDLQHYDGALVYGESIRQVYLRNGWANNVWVWHEAADIRIFRPIRTQSPHEGDLVWIGNWGDDERAEEIREFLIEPVKTLGLKACVYGVRYPATAIQALADAGMEYAGWLPNFEVPNVFAKFRVTVHIPRRPYLTYLRGIPTIRPFEALACGIPLVSAYWDDTENLFTAGADYLVAHDGREMLRHLQQILGNPELAGQLAQHGLDTIRHKHTCAHRVDELLAIYQQTLSVPQGTLT